MTHAAAIQFLRVPAVAWLACMLPTASAGTLVVTYTLEDVWLLPDITRPWEPAQQMTGTFQWTYEQGDFENGSGQFIELDTPWYNPGIENLNITAELTSIEFSLVGNWHDLGLDMTLFLIEPLSPDQPAAIDTVRSIFEIQRGVIWQGHVVSGSIVPVGSTLGDMNCDGAVDAEDIDPFFLALGDAAAYAATFPKCDLSLGDVNNDAGLDAEDIDIFFECIGLGGCP